MRCISARPKGPIARGRLRGLKTVRRTVQCPPTAAWSALIFTAYLPTIASARLGSSVLLPRPAISVTTARSSKRSMHWPHIWPRISISTGSSNWRAEKRRQDGEQHQQNAVGAAIKRQRATDIGRRRFAPAAPHECVGDAHAAIKARAGQRKAERAGHG